MYREVWLSRLEVYSTVSMLQHIKGMCASEYSQFKRRVWLWAWLYLFPW